MKRLLAISTLLVATGAAWATDVGVSVHVNQPGLYGRVDIGKVPQPPVLVYPQPVVIQQTPVVMQQQPIYLHVPPGHAKNWGKHCGKYNACGQRVYFVREDWYQQQYVPAVHHRHHHHDDGHHGKGHGKGHGHGHGKDKHKHKD
jgi:hypothetical protein